MRHAICVTGYGNKAEVLQRTIHILDDPDIDFFIHWDKRYNKPNLNSLYSKITFSSKSIAVKWGGQSQILATLILLKTIKSVAKTYDYVHFISDSDIPLMDKEYFKNFFTKDTYIGFDNKITQKEIIKRIGYYYPANVDFRKSRYLLKIFQFVNEIFEINRLKNNNISKVYKGPNWFSIKYSYIDEIISYYDIKKFLHSYCADELLVQTILGRFKNKQIDSDDDNEQALRYVDWQRGTPYTFTKEDVPELKSKLNTCYAFARKVKDPKIVDSLFG